MMFRCATISFILIGMATYTVIQDIEAEDKLLGPLSMRQFIYAIIVIAFGFVAFMLAKISPILAIPFILPMGFFGLLAAPFGRDQSSETWLLAKIRFMFKPRRRIWDQSGLKQLVTITAPKKVEKHLTNGLDQAQVKSRLTALADTLDSRGWVIKNATASIYTPPLYASPEDSSDRLVAASVTPQAVPTDDIVAADDMLDEQNNPTAQKFESMITQSEQSRRQNLLATMQSPQSAPAPQPQPSGSMPSGTPAQTPAPEPTATPPTPLPNQTAANASPPIMTDEELLEQIHKNKAVQQTSYSHIKRIPTAAERAAEEAAAAKAAAEAEAAQRAEAEAAAEHAEELRRLAANDDLNVATIAREAQKDTDQPQSFDDGEVVISLH